MRGICQGPEISADIQISETVQFIKKAVEKKKFL